MPDKERNTDDQETTFITYEDNNDHAEEFYIEGPLSRSEFDPPDGPLLRFQAYRKSWDKCFRRIKEIVYNLHRPVVHAVVDSIQSAYSGEQVVLPSPELVTLVVSSSDRKNIHEVLSQVISCLNEEDLSSQDGTESDWATSAITLHLSELDCPNVTATMRSIVTGFITQPLSGVAAANMRPSSSLAAYDINVLKAWYQAVKEALGSGVPPLVIVIHDLPAIDPTVLRDILEISSLHVQDLPFIFILGTSDPEHLHSVLPIATLARLRVDKFILPWDVKALENIIKETFFSPKFIPDVMLGPVGFEMIFEEFTRHNSTMDTVLSTLQLLHIQHFYNPLSFLVDAALDVALLKLQDDLPDSWIPFFKLLRQHCLLAIIGAQEEPEQSKWSGIMPREVIRITVEARDTFRARANQMKLALRILETVWTFAQGHGKKTPAFNFETVGLHALRGDLSETSAQDTANLVKQLSPDEAGPLMEEMYHLLHGLPSSTRKIATELKVKVVVAKNDLNEEVIEDFAGFLETYLTQSLTSFQDITCIDVWWTGTTIIPHSPLNPNPHVSIVTTLLEPYEYLGWDTPMAAPHNKELSSLPDACILFRRYVESGKMINIYDWYDSFSLAIEGGEIEEDDGSSVDLDASPSKGRRNGKTKPILKRKHPDEQMETGSRKREIQARFMRSLHELNFVGFLKHTGRKADHVMKTVFDVIES